MAFIGTTDLSRAKAFYSDLLGLQLISEDSFALAYDVGGTMLRVSKVAELKPASYTVLGWNVPDIAGRVSLLSRLGIKFERYPGMQQDDQGIWTAPGGAKVAWFKEPDGQTLSLSQF